MDYHYFYRLFFRFNWSIINYSVEVSGFSSAINFPISEMNILFAFRFINCIFEVRLNWNVWWLVELMRLNCLRWFLGEFTLQKLFFKYVKESFSKRGSSRNESTYIIQCWLINSKIRKMVFSVYLNVYNLFVFLLQQ